MPQIDEYQCSTCETHNEVRQPRCNFCGEPTCLPCRVKGTHFHTVQEMEDFAFGLCLLCRKIVHLRRDANGLYHCPDCDFEWTPRAITGVTEADVMICAFCGARQKKPLLPAPCARCLMILS